MYGFIPIPIFRGEILINHFAGKIVAGWQIIRIEIIVYQ